MPTDAAIDFAIFGRWASHYCACRQPKRPKSSYHAWLQDSFCHRHESALPNSLCWALRSSRKTYPAAYREACALLGLPLPRIFTEAPIRRQYGWEPPNDSAPGVSTAGNLDPAADVLVEVAAGQDARVDLAVLPKFDPRLVAGKELSFDDVAEGNRHVGNSDKHRRKMA